MSLPPPRLPQFKAFKTELLASQDKWINSMRFLAVRLTVCTEVPGAKGKASPAPRTVIGVPFRPLGHHLSLEVGDKPVVLPAANCKMFGAESASYGIYYHHHHHFGLRSECYWNMENGQALLCSSHRVLMAWVWFCHYTVLTITLMGCSLFQFLKSILLQLLCQTETRSVRGWRTGAGRGFGCSLKRLIAGRAVTGIPLSQVLGRTCSLVLVFSVSVPSLSCWVGMCQFLLLQLFPSPWPSAPVPVPFPTWALLPTLTPLCAWAEAHTLKLLFSSFNNILQLISCFLADSHSKSNLWQVLIWVMTTWSTFLVGNYRVRSEQIWYPLTVSEACIFTTHSLEIHL